jgi:di/tricarboxylate transporter
MWSPRSQALAADDVLLVRGEWDKIVDFRKRAGLDDAAAHRDAQGGNAQRVLVEVMVAPASSVEGRTLGELDLAWRYDATVLAIHRRGHVLREKLRDATLQVGDVLLMLVDTDALPRLRGDDRVVVLGEREDAPRTPRKAFIAIGIMALVVIAAGLRWLSIPVAAISGAVAMALTGCYGRKDAYEGIDWKIIIMLGAILPLGIALEKTGLSAMVVHGGMALVGDHGPLAALVMVYLLTALLTELMGHNPSVVLMGGIAISVAHTLGVEPRPFIVAVAFAAATSFATPVGYPTNTMVYYAGGYRFTDFMKIGIPLIGLFCALSMLLIPHFWPFHP